ncbi:MAG: hypothetical protein M3245_00290 [Actinomycetota bacterium]|nr:hypothetical protein [Actinomycetota bacterium]
MSRALMAGLTAVLLLGVTPVGAGAGVTDVQSLSAGGQEVRHPQVAVDRDGDALVVWERRDGSSGNWWRVQARWRSAAGVLSDVQNLSPAGQDAQDPQVAMDRNGNAVVVWEVTSYSPTEGGESVQARRRSASGTLGPVRTLSDPGQKADDPQVAMDPGGNAVVVWRRYDGANSRIQARARSASGALSGVQTLSAAGRMAQHPQVAVDLAGNAVVVWERYDGANWRIQARRRSASGGVLSAVQTLSPKGEDDFYPQVAVDGGGNAVVVWYRFQAGMHRLVQARGRSASGVLSAVQTLSPEWEDAYDPQVAVGRRGNAVVVWENGSFGWQVQARGRSASGALSDVQTLSPAGGNAYDPQVAVDPGGNAVVVWRRHGGANWRVQSRGRSASGALSAVETLSPVGQDANDPQVAVDSGGNAVVVWENDTNSRIQGVGLI